ncbi:hypothetical protein EOL70_15740, partial [Leucothrix sargassi]
VEDYALTIEETRIEDAVIFIDSNQNGTLDVDEMPMVNVDVVITNSGGTVVSSAVSDSSGVARFYDLPIGTGYTMTIYHQGRILSQSTGLEVTDSPLITMPMPIDPSGKVYDSGSRDLIEGAFLQLTDASGTVLPASCVLAGQQPQTTGTDGYYRFDIVTGADALCPASETEYRISVTPPAGYLAPNSTVIPPQPGAYNPSGATTNEIVPTVDRPQGADDTIYYMAFLLEAGDPDTVNNHIPLDPVAAPDPNALPTEITPAECAITSPSTQFWQLRVEWTSTTTSGGTVPSFNPINLDTNFLSRAEPFTFGSGVSVVNEDTLTKLSGVDQSNFADAYRDGDYLEYTLQTQTTIGNTLILSGFSENGGRLSGDSYKMDLLISEDNFATAVRLHTGFQVDGSIDPDSGNTFTWIKDNLTEMYVKPDTEYKIRAVMYDATTVAGAVSMDDFRISFDHCSDRGDAPYAGGEAEGAHFIPEVRAHYIGTVSPDAEYFVTSDDNTSGETTTDEEAGVLLPGFVVGAAATIEVPVVGVGGKLNAWIDWNGNDVFDASEKIATDEQLAGGASSGVISLNVTVPATAVAGNTYARFRWSPNSVINATDDVSDGEIEDYEVTISNLPALTALPPLNPGSCGAIEAESYLLDGLGIGAEQRYQLASGSATHDPDTFFGPTGAELGYIKQADGSINYYFNGEAPADTISTQVGSASYRNSSSVGGNEADQTDAAEFWRITARLHGEPGQTYNLSITNGNAHEFIHYWAEDSAGNVIDTSLGKTNTANGWMYGTGTANSTSSDNGATSITSQGTTPISYTIPASNTDGIVYLRVLVLDPQVGWGPVEFESAPSCPAELTLLKEVVNDDAGSALDTDWTLTADNGTDSISGIEGDAAITSAIVDPATYTLSESGPVGYTQTDMSCTGAADTDVSDGLTLAAGEVVTCTFTNNDNPLSYGTSDASVDGFCSVADNYITIPFEGDGATTVSNITVTTTSTEGSGYTVNSLWSAYDTDTSIFDESEHTTWNTGLGFNDLFYTRPAHINGLNDVFTQTFTGYSVYDVYVHVNSLDQVGFKFDPANNPNMGWEIVSKNDDAVNDGDQTTLFLVDGLDADQDASRDHETFGGDAGRSADGTIRLFSTNGQPITQIVWSLTEDPNRTNKNDRFQMAMEVCGKPAILTLQKTLINDNTRTAVNTDWTLTATDTITTVSGAHGSAAVTPVFLSESTYTLSESGPTGYSQTDLSCTGGADTDLSDGLTLLAGENVSCVFTNDDWGFDYGDAPETYGTSLAANGPRHLISETVFLGTAMPDEEADGQPTVDADGDNDIGSNDESGVSFPFLTLGSSATLTVAVNQGAANEGYLQGWIDWNGDGDFLDANEQVANNLQLSSGTNGNITVPVTVPGLGDAFAGDTYARFRWSSTANLDLTTSATDGEVEDYKITILTRTVPTMGSCPAGPIGLIDLNFTNPTDTAGGKLQVGESLRFENVATVNGQVIDVIAEAMSMRNMTALDSFFATSNSHNLTLEANSSGNPGTTISTTMKYTLVADGTTTPVPASFEVLIADIDLIDNQRRERLIFTESEADGYFLDANTAVEATYDGTYLTFSGTQNFSSSLPESAVKVLFINRSSYTITHVTSKLSAVNRSTGRAGFKTDSSGLTVLPACDQYDYGDAPSSYGTQGVTTAAAHKTLTDIYLGSRKPDSETNGLPTTAANGDDNDESDDEDGISSFASLSASDSQYEVTVKASNTTGRGGRLMAWIDFDRNGTFDNNEAASRFIPSGATSTNYVLRWTNIPQDIQAGATYLRVRTTTDAINVSDATGVMSDGEVEDYPLTIVVSEVAVSGRVFIDANSNASNDSGEAGIGGTVVVLRDTSTGVCQSVKTNGGGYYSFNRIANGNYELYQAHGETIPTPQNCGIGFVNNPTGYQSTTADSLSVTVSGSNVTNQNFGEVAGANSPTSGNTGAGIYFTPDNQSVTAPDSVVFYAHKFRSEADGAVRFTTSGSGNVTSGWSDLLYRDSNCNGILDGNEAAQAIAGFNLGVAANSELCLINKVYAPSNVAAQDRYIVETTATFSYAGSGLAPVILTVDDTTTAGQASQPTTAPASVTPPVGASALELNKTVENLTQGTGEVSTSNQAKPGDVLKYRIYYRNTGTGPVTDLKVNDSVPAFTGLVLNSEICESTPTGMNCVPSQSGDAIEWLFTGALTGGTGGYVSYEVVVDN